MTLEEIEAYARSLPSDVLHAILEQCTAQSEDGYILQRDRFAEMVQVHREEAA